MSKIRLVITSLISIVLVSILLIGSTYSIFTSQDIDENTNVYTTGNLKVSYSVSSGVKFTSVIPMTEEEADAVIPYRITVTNTGNVPYQFDVILLDTTSSETNTIDYQYIMTKVGYLEPKALSNCTNNVIKEDVILPAGESVDIDIRVWLDSTLPNSEIGKSFYAKLSIDGLAVYNDNTDINNDILSLRYMNTSSANDFRNATYSTYIKNASFVDYIDTTNASINTETNEKIMWDMSVEQDNSVIAWLEDNSTTDDSGNKYYNLYIGCKEKMYAKSLSWYFSGMISLENISFDNLSIGLSTNIQSMFYGCSSLTSLDLSNWNTSNVTSMNVEAGGMFRGCSSLTSLDLSNWDTSKVTIMRNMFSGCSSLTSLDLSNFDTSKVTHMASMFNNCSSLTSLDVSSFDTSNVTNMTRMFYGCSGLTSLDVSNFDTRKVTNMAAMFGGCSLTSIDLSNWDTSNVTDMGYMFQNCYGLTSLDLSNWDTGNVTTMDGTFQNCGSLVSIDLGKKFDTSKVTSMANLFNGCSSLINLDVSGWDTGNVTYMGNMFQNCSSLTSLDVSNWDTSKVTVMWSMFYGCSKLTATITIKNINMNSANYNNIFGAAATAKDEDGNSIAQITVNYVGDDTTTTDVNESTESLVESMIATKSASSNVVKGICVNCVVEENTE